MDTEAELLPVSVITGFLGSGKTTLLNRLIQHPDMARTAVVINEFGEIGIDSDLVESSDEDIVMMSSGCLCCTIRGELVDTLRGLYVKRARNEVPPFERLVIETTGLADPAPILHTLMADPVLSGRFRLDGVITTVDAVNGAATLDNHFESVKQVAVADRIVMTKSDLAEAPALASLGARLRALNPGADQLQVRHGDIAPGLLFEAGLYNPESKSLDVRRWLREEAYGDSHDHDHEHEHHDVNRHDERIHAFCMTIDEPLAWNSVVTWLELLANYRGEDMLRVKGILNVAESEAPIVVHGVQHLFHPPVQLDSWPSEDRRSRVVFITRDMDADTVESMLSALSDARNVKVV